MSENSPEESFLDLTFLNKIWEKSLGFNPSVRLQVGRKLKIESTVPGRNSLSHVGETLLYARLPRTLAAQIGVDLELTHRPTEEIAERIRKHPKESLGPWPAALWCAKEAGWKSVAGDRQPSTISQIEICSWKKLSNLWNTEGLKVPDPIWTFEIEDLDSFGFSHHSGICFSHRDFTLAFCLLVSK